MPSFASLPKLLDSEIRAKNRRALQHYARGLYWDLARPAAPDPVFVIGCSRSGTTVTYETLAAAPQLRSLGHEIPEFWNALTGPRTNGWHSEAAFAADARPHHRDAAFRYYYQRAGRGRVLDKTCINVMRVQYLNRLFPQATFVYIHRDGRDNVSSMIDGWRHDGHFGLTKLLGPLPEPVAINGGEFDDWAFFLPPGWRDYNHASLEEVCAYQWSTANRMALEAAREIAPERWIQLRYEDIFERPVEMFRETFERLGIAFTEALHARCRDLRPTSIVKGAPKQDKWKDHNPAAIARVVERIRPVMLQLGYSLDA